jgi:hypothetical protein
MEVFRQTDVSGKAKTKQRINYKQENINKI